MKALSRTLREGRPHQTIALASVLMLAACSSTPPPTASMAAARTAIAGAEKADAGHYAAPELAEARAKLAAAEAAITAKTMPAAQRLAEQSAVEADLANAKAGETKAAAVNAEMKQSNAALGEELQRASGSQP